MNLTKSLLLASMSLFFITSCSKEEEDTLTKPQAENAAELDNDNIKYTYGKTIQTKFYNESTDLLSRNNDKVYGSWAEVTPTDLVKLSKPGYSFVNKDAIQNRFTILLNKGPRRPISISVNDYKIGKGSNPNRRYNWKAEVRTIGEKIETKTSKFSKWTSASSRISYPNNSGVRKWMVSGSQMRYTKSETKGWSLGGSVSLEVGGKIGVPLLSEGSTKLTISMSGERNGNSGTSTTEVIQEPVGQWVDPGMYINFEVMQREIIETTKWSIPLEFKGYVGSDFGRKKHHGSHYWAVSAGRYFHEYQNQQVDRTLEVVATKLKEYRPQAWVTDGR